MSIKLDRNFKLIKDLNPNSVVLLKIGSFYHAYGKDAYLLSYLLGYQLKMQDGTFSTCGFPTSAIGKIEKELENKKINYMQISRRDNYAVEEDISFKKDNKYNEFSEKAHKYVLKKNKIDRITAYLTDCINDYDFNEKITKIENILYDNKVEII